MALFGGESKEDKQVRKAYEMMKKYGLEELSDPRDIDNVSNISLRLTGSKLIELGTIMGATGPDNVKMTYLATLVEQNWIIIRMLDKLLNQKSDEL